MKYREVVRQMCAKKKGRGLLPGSRLFWLYIDFCFLVFKDIIKGIPQGVLCNLHRGLYHLP